MSEEILVTYKIPTPPDGWVYDSVRQASAEGELYYNGIQWVKWVRWGHKLKTDGTYPVAVRKQQWRPATAADIGRTDANFYAPGRPSYKGKLIHVSEDNFVAILDGSIGRASNWEYCQVPVT